MPYTFDISIVLGSGRSGLSLNAQLVDSDLSVVGSVISTGFSEVGQGYYLWHYDSFPDDFRGGVKFFEQSSPNTVLTFVSINPDTSVGSSEEINISVGHSNKDIPVSDNPLINAGQKITISTNVEDLGDKITTNSRQVSPAKNIQVITHIEDVA